MDEPFDRLAFPGKLSIFADRYHKVSMTKPNTKVVSRQIELHELTLDRIAGKDLPVERRAGDICSGRGGSVAAPVSERRRCWEDA